MSDWLRNWRKERSGCLYLLHTVYQGLVGLIYNERSGCLYLLYAVYQGLVGLIYKERSECLYLLYTVYQGLVGLIYKERSGCLYLLYAVYQGLVGLIYKERSWCLYLLYTVYQGLVGFTYKWVVIYLIGRVSTFMRVSEELFKPMWNMINVCVKCWSTTFIEDHLHQLIGRPSVAVHENGFAHGKHPSVIDLKRWNTS